MSPNFGYILCCRQLTAKGTEETGRREGPRSVRGLYAGLAGFNFLVGGKYL